MIFGKFSQRSATGVVRAYGRVALADEAQKLSYGRLYRLLGNILLYPINSTRFSAVSGTSIGNLVHGLPRSQHLARLGQAYH